MWNALTYAASLAMSMLQPHHGQHRNDCHLPTVADVLEVKAILQRFSKSSVLPLEIIDIIIDEAEYWPHTSITSHSTDCHASGGAGGGTQDVIAVSPA